jgi:hypothetical protein
MSSSRLKALQNRAERGPRLGALIRLTAQMMTEQLTRWIAESGFTGVQPAHSAVFQPLWELPEGARCCHAVRCGSRSLNHS